MVKISYRELAIQHHQNGKTASEIFNIINAQSSLRTIRRWIKEFKDSGKRSNGIHSGRPRSVNTLANKKKVKRLLGKNSGRSVSRKLNFSVGSLFNIKKELNLKVLFFI